VSFNNICFSCYYYCRNTRFSLSEASVWQVLLILTFNAVRHGVSELAREGWQTGLDNKLPLQLFTTLVALFKIVRLDLQLNVIYTYRNIECIIKLIGIQCGFIIVKFFCPVVTQFQKYRCLSLTLMLLTDLPALMSVWVLTPQWLMEFVHLFLPLAKFNAEIWSPLNRWHILQE
jgi:hypothetical protein